MVQEYVSREMIADGVRKARDSGAFFARDGAADLLALLRQREVATQRRAAQTAGWNACDEAASTR